MPLNASVRAGLLSRCYPAVFVDEGGRHYTPEMEVWSSIEASPFAQVYLAELYWLADALARDATAIFAEFPEPPVDGSFIRVDPALHHQLLGLLNTAARVKALISPRPKNRHQTRQQHEVQVRRARWLRGKLDGLDLSEIENDSVRHSLEHFDEYLDRTALTAATREIRPPALMPFDVALGKRDTLAVFPIDGASAQVEFLRVYLVDEKVVVNCGREVRVDMLRDQAAGVRDRLVHEVPERERGGLMLLITEGTFLPIRAAGASE